MPNARTLAVVAVLVACGAVLVLLVLPEREAVHPGDAPLLEGEDPEVEAEATLRGRPLPADPARSIDETLAEGDVLLRGRVVGPDERPAPNVTIEVFHEETVIARGVSAAYGTFAVRLAAEDIAESWQGRLDATDAEGHRGVRVVHWGPRPGTQLPHAFPPAIGPVVEVGLVRLLRTYALDVEVRFPPGATPPATVHVGGRDNHLRVSLGTHETDAQGRLRLEGLPEGTRRLLATAEGSGRGSAFVTLPRDEVGPFVIDLPVERVVTVEVVDGATRAPIEDAVVAVTEHVQAPGTSYSASAPWWPPLAPSRTDAAGRLVIRGLPPEQRLGLSANAEGHPHVYGNTCSFGTARLEAGATHVLIELPPPRTVRWPIEDGTTPRPPEGARIDVRHSPGSYLANAQVPREGRIESGELVVEGWPPGPLHGQAVAPDGAIARLFAKNGTDTGMPTTFFPARRVEAIVRYPDGEPAVGFFVILRNQGNNPVGSPTPTDATGRAVIEGLYGGSHSLLQVHVSDVAMVWGGALLGTVDLEQGDGHVEGTIARTREALLRFTVDGERRLPPAPRVQVGTPTPQTPERDEEAAEIRLVWRPVPLHSEAHLSVEAEGLLPFSTKVPVPPVGTPLVADVVLESAGAFVVRVKLPEDGSVRVVPQAWSEEQNTWGGRLWLPMTRMGGYAKPDANGRIRFAPLAAGRYRALDTVAGIATSPVEVRPGAADAEVELDAGRSGHARGRVALPDGVDASGVLVRVEGAESFNNFSSGIPGAQGVVTRLRQDGTFWIRVPGDREVVLRPEAPTLRPHATRGVARVTTPRDGIVLELVRDRVATLRLEEALPTYGQPGRTLTRTVLLYVGDARGEPAFRTEAIVQDEGRTLVFGGFEPGTYTVWVDAQPFAPVALPGRVLEDATTDLGDVEVPDGARVVVELLLPEGQSAPRAYAWAVRQGEPAYRRVVNWQGKRGVLKGLGPGRYELTVGSHMNSGLRRVETIEVAEDGEHQVTIDLR